MEEHRSSAAVIGAAGFLGSALVGTLRARGVPVAAFTRQIPFLTDEGRLAAGLATADTVFWLATSINPALAEAEPARVESDRRAFAALLRAVRGRPTPPRVVLLSSGGTVYDPDAPPPYREDAPTRPRNAYGRAKLELERLLAAEGPEAGRSVAVRVANAYGPGQRAASGQGVIAYWLRAVAADEPIRVYGDPDTTRDYVYVDDIATALAAVHAHPGPLPAALNVGSGRATSLRDLVEIVRTVTGDGTRVEFEPARGFDVPHSWLDTGLATRALGWSPATDLVTGVGAAWEAARRAHQPTSATLQTATATD